MTGLPDAGTDPAGFLLAVAELRIDRTVQAGAKRQVVRAIVSQYRQPLREFVVAEANEAHVLAEVALWRQVAEDYAADDDRGAFGSVMDFAVGAARAYLTGADG